MGEEGGGEGEEGRALSEEPVMRMFSLWGANATELTSASCASTRAVGFVGAPRVSHLRRPRVEFLRQRSTLTVFTYINSRRSSPTEAKMFSWRPCHATSCDPATPVSLCAPCSQGGEREAYLNDRGVTFVDCEGLHDRVALGVAVDVPAPRVLQSVAARKTRTSGILTSGKPSCPPTR